MVSLETVGRSSTAEMDTLWLHGDATRDDLESPCAENTASLGLYEVNAVSAQE